MFVFEERYKSHHSASGRLKNVYKKEVNKEEYFLEFLNTEATNERALYVHVPYCTKLCSFCQFPQGQQSTKKDYHNIVIDHIKAQRDFKYMEKPFQSVYFGGGTPTSLEPYQMEEILKCIHDSYRLTEDCEISVETSVSELSPQMIDTLLKNKVNRLSIGVQTFDDSLRKLLGRRGTGQAAKDKLKELKTAGFKNLNIDLIYNNPGETLETLQKDIDSIIAAEIAGFSFYSLMLIDNSPLSKKITADEVACMKNIDNEYKQFMLILDSLKPHGYEMFEFTKLIRNKMDLYKYITVRQNAGDCIGVGYAAGGNINGYTYYNMFDYMPISQKVPFSAMGSVLDTTYYQLEKFVGNLQKTSINVAEYNSILNLPITDILAPSIEKFVDAGYCLYENGQLSTTELGSFWGNNIIDHFLKEILASLPQPEQTSKHPGAMMGSHKMDKK
ncbi:MAG: coproporphyrinogen-III oxidase family protein [Spirochaetales bacterium]